AKGNRFSKLTRLRVGRNDLNPATLAPLFACPQLGALADLELGNAEIDPDAVRALGAAAFAQTLERLDLEGATLPDAGIYDLARCTLPALKTLRLNSINLHDDVHALNGAPFAATLETLELDNCELRSEVVRLLYPKKFPALKTLDLSRNRIQNIGASTLAAYAKTFPALTSLKLWDNQIGPKGVGALSRSKLLANLTELDLSANKIGPAGAEDLAKSKYLKKLTSLTVDEKAVGKKGRKALVDRFGEGVVSWR
ncbi:MAG: hypothetical protein K2V38_12340, partial [Gemmataceae bacterium]|nr:hypothetical protein [Gemmataceae bacterium]